MHWETVPKKKKKKKKTGTVFIVGSSSLYFRLLTIGKALFIIEERIPYTTIENIQTN